MNKKIIEDNEHKLQFAHGQLLWKQHEGHWRLCVQDLMGKTLAYEGEHTGYWTYWWGEFRRLSIPVTSCPKVKTGAVVWEWQELIEKTIVRVLAKFVRTEDRKAIRFSISFCFDQATARPHFSWGLDIAVEGTLNDYHWVPNPTATAYSFANPLMTIWLVSTYDKANGVTKFDGCQALITIPRDRVMHSSSFQEKSLPERHLEMHVRMPPGYEDICKRHNVLPAGQETILHGYILLAEGYFDESVAQAHKLHPLEPLPKRFSYRCHLSEVVDNLLDPNKYFDEHEGKMLYCYGPGPSQEPKICIGREGPGWGGGFDTEVATYLMRYRELNEDERERKEMLKQHVRCMIDGWLTNPRFNFGSDLIWRIPGDMRGSMSPSLEWKRRSNPPIVWTTHQAYMIYFLVDLYLLGGWDDCLQKAIETGEWFLRNQQSDGGIPGLWTVEVNHAIPWGGEQPASTLFMIPALLKLNKVAPDERWLTAARCLAERYVDQLMVSRPEYGNGEMEWVVWEVKSITSTSLAYIIWAYADAYDIWPQDRFREVLERYGRMLLALGASWEPNEELLRGPEKVKIPPYGMDRKIAGGLSHGCFRHFFHWQMNRNEAGYALLRAWEVLEDPVYLDWLRAFIDWHTYFVITEEVEFSPVTTLGSSPQNHRWTSNVEASWNNDWGCTAAKMAFLILDCLEKQIICDR